MSRKITLWAAPVAATGPKSMWQVTIEQPH